MPPGPEVAANPFDDDPQREQEDHQHLVGVARDYVGIGVSIALAALAAVADGGGAPLRAHLWLVAGLVVLTALAVLAAPLYHRWYRHMRRAGSDDRGVTPSFGPPAPEEVWNPGVPDLHPLERRDH